jgi:hypothetical protein
MESKPIYFRPSEKDKEVLSLIAKQHPVFAESPTELLRIALEAYWYEHGSDAKRSKSARLDTHESLLVRICEHLGVQYADLLAK